MGAGGALRKNEISMVLHFVGLGLMSFISHQSTRESMCVCNCGGSDLLTTSSRLRSSTYFQRFSVDNAASLTIIRKIIGPNLVPCGTPQSTIEVGQIWCNPTITNSLRSLRQETTDSWENGAVNSYVNHFSDCCDMVDMIESFTEIDHA